MELISERRLEGAQRRRAQAPVPRRRQVVVRFSDAEFVLVRERATLAGLAVGAWIGQTAIDAAECGTSTPFGLPDLLRLHADVALVAQLSADEVFSERVARLLARLDAAIDVAVSELERGGR